MALKTFPSAPSNDHLESSHVTWEPLLLWSLSPHPRCLPTAQVIYKQHRFHICVNSKGSAELPKLKLEDIETAETAYGQKSLDDFLFSSCRLNTTWQYIYCILSEKFCWGFCICEQGINKRVCILHTLLLHTLLTWSFFHFVYIVCSQYIFYVQNKFCIAHVRLFLSGHKIHITRTSSRQIDTHRIYT